MAPGTVMATYANKVRDREYGGTGPIGAGLDVGLKDVSLIADTLAGGGSGMPTLTALLDNMRAATTSVGGSEAASRYEFCVMAREVEMRALGFTSPLPGEPRADDSHGAGRPRANSGGGSSHPAGFSKPTTKRIAL